jgi:hypothetical protein
MLKRKDGLHSCYYDFDYETTVVSVQVDPDNQVDSIFNAIKGKDVCVEYGSSYTYYLNNVALDKTKTIAS